MSEFTVDVFIDTVLFIYAIVLGKFLGVVITAVVATF